MNNVAEKWNATLNERGNGLPDAGDYVPGDDGQLYRVVETASTIHAGSPGAGNYVYARVELADWSDCEEGEEHSALAIVEVVS
jgi:hypothetical protein